jgi:hypothetical protein
MLAGVLAYAQFTPQVDAWYTANAVPDLTLPSITGVAMGWYVLAFVAFLLFAAWGMGKLEGMFGHWRPER